MAAPWKIHAQLLRQKTTSTILKLITSRVLLQCRAIATKQHQTYEEYAQKGHYQQSDWSQRWENKTTGWQLEEINPYLIQRYESHLKKDHDGKSNIFVPLCGKSLDMIWLARKGNRVVGVEVVEEPCHEYFKDHDIEYEVKSLPGIGKVMSSQVGELDIHIYNCDYFALTQQILGFAFDSVWDRGSFIAMNPTVRRRYAKHLHSLMAPNASGLIITVVYDISARLKPGPPFCVPDDVLQDVFSPHATTQKLSSVVLTGERVARFEGLTSMDESTFYVQFKQ